MTERVLVARLDSAGDVLLAGPAVRAVSAQADHVIFLAGPRGRAAAELLPGVDEVVEFQAPWVDFDPPPVTSESMASLVRCLRHRRIDRAVILTSFHQSALPLALLLRLAGVPWIGAISVDYAGALLDVRHNVDDDIPEAERALSLVRACGFQLPADDDGTLGIREPLHDPAPLIGLPGYVVVHPGAAVPARRMSADRSRRAVRSLLGDGYRVVVTGGPDERALTADVACSGAIDLGGRTTLRELAGVLAAAEVVIAPNTGVAHLAAAVGTPVVSLFAPVVPAVRWAPYRVHTVMLGDQRAPCAGSRARICPVPGHPCLESVTISEILGAVRRLEVSQ